MITIRKPVIVFQRILPHYRVGFFNKLVKKFPGMKIIYGQPVKDEPIKNAQDIDKNIFINTVNYYFDKKGKIFISKILSEVNRIKPGITISVFNVGNLNIYFLFLLRRFLKFKIILWSFGYDPVRGFNPDKSFTDKVRLYLSQKADAVIFYWNKGMEEIAKFSSRTDHYFVANNTLDTDRQFGLKESFDITGKENIKHELGIKNKFHFVFVGRLLEDKQIDILLRAFSLVEKKNNDCGLSIIGEGPERNRLVSLSEELNLNNVNFRGEITDDKETGEWIYVSDAFVMPGRLGLSVVHSFCFGTPVISQKKDGHFHGEGIGYLKDGENGFLAEDGNVSELAGKMLQIISNPELAKRLRQNAFNTAKVECSVDIMLNGFEKAIEYVARKY